MAADFMCTLQEFVLSILDTGYRPLDDYSRILNKTQILNIDQTESSSSLRYYEVVTAIDFVFSGFIRVLWSPDAKR